METKANREKKLEICKACDRYIELTGQCKECGCFMSLKTWMKGNTCPLEKHNLEENNG